MQYKLDNYQLLSYSLVDGHCISFQFHILNKCFEIFFSTYVSIWNGIFCSQCFLEVRLLKQSIYVMRILKILQQ